MSCVWCLVSCLLRCETPRVCDFLCSVLVVPLPHYRAHVICCLAFFMYPHAIKNPTDQRSAKAQNDDVLFHGAPSLSRSRAWPFHSLSSRRARPLLCSQDPNPTRLAFPAVSTKPFSFPPVHRSRTPLFARFPEHGYECSCFAGASREPPRRGVPPRLLPVPVMRS